MYAEITFPLHAQRGAAYLTAPNIPARHAFSTRLGLMHMISVFFFVS